MTSTIQKIALAFEKVRRINAAYWETMEAGADDSMVTRLKQIVLDLYGVEATIEEVDFKAEHLRGLIEIYDGGARARIYIRADQTPKWKYLVSVKELCHAILDRREDWCPHPMETLGKLMSGGLINLDAPENNGVRSESLAELVAHELAYPHEHRRADLEKLRLKTTTLKDLSDRYTIPEEIVERILSQQYLAACDYYWRQVVAPREASAQ